MDIPTKVTSNEILALWFSEETKPLWYSSTPEFDQELHDKYLDTYRAALNGELSAWEDSPQGALALVICLDQFPLNMFRGKVEGFEGEEPSRQVAARAIEKGFDLDLDDTQKAFLYIPYMHSEELADQDRVLELFSKAGLEDNLKWARHHREIVTRFGRFPHRNAILGRQSTPDEIAYLQSDEAFTG